MLHKYEMHVHDSLCSHCGHNPPEIIAKVYYDRGYAGMIRRAEEKTKILKLNHLSFVEVIRQKMRDS